MFLECHVEAQGRIIISRISASHIALTGAVAQNGQAQSRQYCRCRAGKARLSSRASEKFEHVGSNGAVRSGEKNTRR